MKKITIEQKLIASRPNDFKINERFVRSTALAVKKVATSNLFENAIGQAKLRHRLLFRLKTLPTASLAALIVATLLITSGAVYAAAHFVPDLIKIFGKTETSRGTTEYFVPGFEDCAEAHYEKVSKFELKKDAPKLSDEEVTKIIQAKCELGLIDGFVRSVWPTTGNEPDSFEKVSYFARAEVIGTYSSIKDGDIVYSVDGKYENGSNLAFYQKNVAPNNKLKVFSQGREIPVKSLQGSEPVFIIMQVKEVTRGSANPEAEVLGVLGLIKLSLPLEYYGQFQDYLTEIPACSGNEKEFCPSTGSIDIFPAGGESSAEPAPKFGEDYIFRRISGVVTKLSAGSLTLKSSSGGLYSVQMAKDDFANYNDNYAKNYTDINAALKIGSTVSVSYAQPPNADPKSISANQVSRIDLLIDFINVKQGGTSKPY